MQYHAEVKDADVEALVKTYFNEYDHDAALEDKTTEAYQKVWNSAKAELALRAILKAKGAKGFTTNFDDLGQTDGSHFDQIPGLASQRLMADGYGFGAEGDWKSAALYRTVWVMNQGLPTGCSFLEDYTLNFNGENSSILQAHMLEVCPLIAAQKPRLEVHFLGIGIRKSQTARLVFTSKVGTGCTATVVDLGNRFRLIVNDVECIEPKPPCSFRIVETHAELRNRRRCLDFGRWYTPFLLLIRLDSRILGRLRRNLRYRNGTHQQRHHHQRVQEGTPHERSLLYAEQSTLLIAYQQRI